MECHAILDAISGQEVEKRIGRQKLVERIMVRRPSLAFSISGGLFHAKPTDDMDVGVPRSPQPLVSRPSGFRAQF